VNNYAALAPANVNTTALGCPSIDATNYAAPSSTLFTYRCGVELRGGGIGSNDINGEAGSGLITLAEVFAYSVDQCIDACDVMNSWWGTPPVCNSVTFNTHMSTWTSGNCWLFNTTLAAYDHPVEDGYCSASLVSS
jgi:hypothetical protein